MKLVLLLVPLLLLPSLGCGPGSSDSGLIPESDVGIDIDEQRDVMLPVAGELTRVTDLPGAEESEVVSPDGAWVAFIADATGWASVWVAPMPDASGEPGEPIQLTNVGLEHQPRTPGQAPRGFVPVPDTRGALRWTSPSTVSWTAGGVTYSAEVPR